jgi:Spy/CpxP family protein refolding chaperone
MSDHDPTSERNVPAAPRGWLRRRRAVIVAGLAAVAVIAAVGTPAGRGLSRHILYQMPVIGPELAAAAPFDDGPGGWRGGLFDGMIEAVVEDRADRAVRHISIEIDATSEQQEKLRAIVHDAIKDLLPVRTKLMAARTAARDILTQDTVDRAALERLRTEMLATHDAVSRRLVQAVADAADVLTAEQRRKLADMAAAHHARWGGWGHGPWGHGPWPH